MRWSPFIALALLAAGCDRHKGDAGQAAAPANATAQAASPDEVAPAAAPASAAQAAGAIDRSHAGEAAPAYAFADPGGKTVTLASFRGKPVLLNLWATWCGPCIKELPTLDALAAREKNRLTVVTLAQDNDATKPAPFLAARHLGTLRAYTDAQLRWLPAIGGSLPTTILYGADGRERWRVSGPRDWGSAETQAALGA